MSERPIKLTIAALGGQGGGVLATWLVKAAEAEGYLAQTTSVPGVAQRTGATIYYLEFFPRAAAIRAGREPIMALMPVAGDVDCVIASELAEAGRAIQRGLVTPDKTTLIASSHRSFTISEKSAMGSGVVDAVELTKLARQQSKRLIMFDLDAVAQRHHSVVSSVMLGALCGSGVLPFARTTFESVITSSGIAVEANLAAFADAAERASRGEAVGPNVGVQAGHSAVPERARSPSLQPLLDRIRKFPPETQSLVFEGVKRMIDYQDVGYAKLYLDRLEVVVAEDASLHGMGRGWRLTEETARGLALWMSFEDTIRVADLKTRRARIERVREEIRAKPTQIFGITEFMKPRVVEIAGTLPAAWGRWLIKSPRVSRLVARGTGGKKVRTRSLRGFLLLHMLSSLRRWRRGTLRYHEEDARIELWLARIAMVAKRNYSLGVELARAQRLVKGYGDTHERGLHNFNLLVDRLEQLAPRADGAEIFSKLQAAALADDQGLTLRRELSAI